MSFITQPIQDVLIGPSRQIEQIAVQCIIDESTTDVLTITKQPVATGASITDHSFKEPTQLAMTILFGADPLLFISLKDIYQDLQDLQNSRQPFTITTPKRIYSNMLFASLGLTTDKRTENVLSIRASFQEVILVTVGVVDVAPSRQKNTRSTAATKNAGPKNSLLEKGVNIKNKVTGG